MKRSKGLFKEFKEFITRGNVIDLAVGMIIGAAFTAIVTALVDGVFKPLINAIPMGTDLSGLITMLVPAYTETGAIDLANSVYINWGELIMAIVSFLLTAVILFVIIKLINTLRGGVSKATRPINITKEEKAELKAQGMTRKQMREYVAKREEEEAAKAAEEAAKNAPETPEQILKDIRELLKSLQPVQAAAIEQAVEAAVDKK